MKESTINERQNDAKAITLLRASSKCLSNERTVKYFMITLSFLICILAIFNRYLPHIFGETEQILDIQAKASTYLNLISGAILVAGIPLGFRCSRMHTEGTVLRDRYDAYVFDNPSNLSILRPISDDVISLYARKTHGADKRFCNYIYGKDDVVNEATAQFEYISKEAHFDYNLYLSVQPFFIALWVGFCLLIVLIAVSFNDMFITTLINIMIPSLSAINTIGNSWYNCRLQMRQLTNLLSVIDRIQSMPIEKRQQYIANKENMRLLADGLFNYRVSPFVIPNFLIRLHIRNLSKFRKSGKSADVLTKITPEEECATTTSEPEPSAPETFKIMPEEAAEMSPVPEETENKTPLEELAEQEPAKPKRTRKPQSTPAAKKPPENAAREQPVKSAADEAKKKPAPKRAATAQKPATHKK